MRKLLALAAAAVLPIALAAPVAAGTSTATLTISATLTTSCTFASPTASYDASALAAVATGGTSATQTLGITCTNALPYTVTATPGNAGACSITPYSRYMQTGGNKISYGLNLISPAGQWCDGTGGTTKASATGTGASQTIAYTIGLPGYASDTLDTAHTPYPAGSYSDSVTLTATF